VPEPKVPDDIVIETLRRLGSPTKAAKELGMDIRNIYKRRDAIQKKTGIFVPSYNASQESVVKTIIPENKRIISHKVENGMVFIASDCHYWPGEVTVAHKAFIALLTEFKPKTIILNGDVFDGSRISRHEPLMGTNPPTPKQEIEACQDRLNEIKNASKNAHCLWTFGNHDVRLHRYIAINAPELSDFTHLFDYFPGWHTGWRVDINDDVVVKHRWHNGQHATYNNTLKSGRSIVTGHLHKLQVTPWSDYNGRRYGVDTGTLAEPYGEQFTYTECNPVNWCSGFCVLTFKNGKLLPPELCEVIDGVAYFRGESVTGE
jgi:predicted phosphodiesterase